jgi:hypothetical protein
MKRSVIRGIQREAFAAGVRAALRAVVPTENENGEPQKVAVMRLQGVAGFADGCYVRAQDGTTFGPLTTRDAAALFTECLLGD